jgi:Mg/Co/Ni transporter MgtE
VVDLLRGDPTTMVEDEPGMVDLRVSAGADLADVSMMMADYNLTALAVTDTTSVLVGAISVDDVLEALVPENWRNRVEASSGV